MPESGVSLHRRLRLELLLPALVMLAVGVGAFATRDLWGLYFESGDVAYRAPIAGELAVDTPDQIVYRIDPSRSSAYYQVQEHLAGIDRTATGSTEAIAGDIRVDSADPTRSVVGEIVINVELFTSDNSLRDKRIRHDFLESSEFPFVTFAPTDVVGLPASFVEGQIFEITITGDLTVKATTAAATFSGTVSVESGELVAHMESVVKSSTFDVGPITISGLVSTSDDVTLAIDFVAPDVAGSDLAPGALTDSATALDQAVVYDPDAPGDFARSVMGVLAENCARCHNEGGVGASTWALDTAGDAAEVADGLVLVTSSAYMPPWPATDQGLVFHDSWRLSADELEAIDTWATAGGLIDVPADTPIDAPAVDMNTIEHDVTIRAAAPYAGTAEHADDYRCQIFDIPHDQTAWVIGMEFMPEQTAVVHHAVVYRAPASLRGAADAVDDAESGPGWTCYGLTEISNGDAHPDQLMAWTPGQQPQEFSPGTGLAFEPGDFVIAQVHYHYDHEFPLDASTMAFDLASPAQLDAAGGSLAPIENRVLIAPAEIPCLPTESGPMCERDNVLKRLQDEFGDGSGPDSILRSCGKRLEDVAVLVDGVARSSCDFPIEGSADLLTVFGHMHEFGETFRMTLNPGRADQQVLLDIPNWSFEWQFDYRFEQPVRLSRGDTVRIECSWNRARVEQPEPAYVTWSDGTQDEMCYSTVTYTIP